MNLGKQCVNPDTFTLLPPPFPTIASRAAATGEEWLLQRTLNYDVSSKLKGLKNSCWCCCYYYYHYQTIHQLNLINLETSEFLLLEVSKQREARSWSRISMRNIQRLGSLTIKSSWRFCSVLSALEDEKKLVCSRRRWALERGQLVMTTIALGFRVTIHTCGGSKGKHEVRGNWPFSSASFK